MTDRENNKRLAAALDRWLEGEADLEAEEELRSFRPLVAALREALPPDTPDPAFHDSLRARLLAKAHPSLMQRLRFVGSCALGWLPNASRQRGAAIAWPRSLLLGGAVATLLVAYALLILYSRMVPTLQPSTASVPGTIVNDLGTPLAVGAREPAGSSAPALTAPLAAAATPAATAAEAPMAKAAPADSVPEEGGATPPAAAAETLAAAPTAAEKRASVASEPAEPSIPVPTSAAEAAVESPPATAPTPTSPALPTAIAAVPTPTAPATFALVPLPPVDATEPKSAMAAAPVGAGVGAQAIQPDSPGTRGRGVATLSTQQSEPTLSVQYEMQAQWPDIPASLPVYKLKPEAETLEAARALAQRLGVDPSLVQTVGGDGAPAYFSADTSAASFQLSADGRLEWEDRTATPSSLALSDADLMAAAQRWLDDRGLRPAGATPVLTPADASQPYRLVVFSPAGIPALRSELRIEVGILPDGQVVHLWKQWPGVEVASYPAQSRSQLEKALQEGRGKPRLAPDPGFPRQAEADMKATITAARVDYLLTYTVDGQQYLQPVLVLEGEARLGRLKASGLPASQQQQLLDQHYTLTVSLPLVADQYQTSYHVQFQLAAGLPAVPAEAARYVFPAPTPVSLTDVKALGAKLGLAGEPTLLTEGADPADSVREYRWQGPDGYVLRVPADPQPGYLLAWSYGQAQPAPAPSNVKGQPLAPEKAAALATEWLRQHQLLSSDLGAAEVIDSSPHGSDVLFPFLLNGIQVLDENAFTVSLSPAGEIVNVTSFRLPTQPQQQLALLTPAEALAAVQAGQGEISLSVRVLSRDQIQSDQARITSVELVYARDEVSAGEAEPSYVPIYRFAGVMQLVGSQEPVSFTVILPATRS